MIDNEFRNDKITITRDEMADIVAVEVVKIMNGARKRVENRGEEIDTKLFDMVQTVLLAYSADIMTVLFDEGKIGDLEIEEDNGGSK